MVYYRAGIEDMCFYRQDSEFNFGSRWMCGKYCRILDIFFIWPLDWINLLYYVRDVCCESINVLIYTIRKEKNPFVATFCLENIYQKQFGGILHQNDIS